MRVFYLVATLASWIALISAAPAVPNGDVARLEDRAAKTTTTTKAQSTTATTTTVNVASALAAIISEVPASKVLSSLVAEIEALSGVINPTVASSIIAKITSLSTKKATEAKVISSIESVITAIPASVLRVSTAKTTATTGKTSTSTKTTKTSTSTKATKTSTSTRTAKTSTSTKTTKTSTSTKTTKTSTSTKTTKTSTSTTKSSTTTGKTSAKTTSKSTSSSALPSTTSSSTSSASSSAISSSAISSSTVSSSASDSSTISSVTASTSANSTSSSSTSSASSTASVCSGNSATDRSSWCDYDLSTDYYNEVPDTGVTREYYFDLVQTTASPDGYSRMVLTVNGTVPGPTIFADWGDTVKVHVTNNLDASENGTSIHFHGVRQNYTNQNDGVVSITQCPTAPGSSITYTWRATQYGSSWYHSHFGLQAWEGVFGGIVINGPASANYDEDLGLLFLNDWSHQTADSLYQSAQESGPPTLDNALINGTNVYGDDDSTDQTGSRYNVSVTSGTSYRFRIVNGAIDTHFKFMIDNHTMTVMSTDFVPITPYETTVLNIAMGQRYDIVVTMDQAAVASDFWIRAIPQAACSENDSTDNIKGILHYGTSDSTPTTTAYSFNDECVDEDMSSLVPYLTMNADSSYWQKTENATVSFNSDNLFRWYMNSISMEVEWDDPTLLQIYNGDDSWSTTAGVIALADADEWAYIIIQTDLAVPHPIHLHGHDFLILAQGSGTFNSSDTLTLTNPPRRDVAILPQSGHLVIAFKTDNPGAWLCHCHIGWHTSEGFAIQFVERFDEIADIIDYDSLNSNCAAWDTYATSSGVEMEDSGV